MTKYIEPIKSKRMVNDSLGNNIPNFTTNIEPIKEGVNSALNILNKFKVEEQEKLKKSLNNLSEINYLKLQEMFMEDKTKYLENKDLYNDKSYREKFNKDIEMLQKQFEAAYINSGGNQEEFEQIKLKNDMLLKKHQFDFMGNAFKYFDEKDKKDSILSIYNTSELGRNLISSGEIGEGRNLILNATKKIHESIESGSISAEKGISLLNNLKNDSIQGETINLINSFNNLSLEEKEQEVKKLYDMGFNEFKTTFEHYGNNNIILTEDEYNTFNNTLKNELTAIETKRKGIKEDLKYDEMNAEKERQNSPLSTALKEYKVPKGTPLTYRPDILVKASNNKYKTNFSSIDDLRLNQVPVISIQDNLNNKGQLYQTVDLEPSELFNMRVEEYNEVAKGHGEENERYILNSQYDPKKYKYIISYDEMQEIRGNNNGEYANIYNKIYTKENKQFLNSVEKVQIQVLDFIKDEELQNKMLGLKQNGAFDRDKEFSYQNINNRIEHILKLKVLEYTGGVVDKSILKKTKLQLNGGELIADLNPSQQQAYFKEVLNQRDFKKSAIFGSNTFDEIQEDLKEIINVQSKNDYGYNTKYGSFILNKQMDGEQIEKTLNKYIYDTEFYTPNKKIAPKSKIYVNTVGNTIFFNYGGEQLRDENGKLLTIDF